MTALIALLGGVRATVFASLLLAALAATGIQSHRLGNAQEARDDAQARLAVANERIEGFRGLLVQVNAAADEQLAKAKAKADAGAAAAAQARAEADRLAAALTDAQRRMQAAKSDPTCAEQLRIQLCPQIPIL